MVFLMELARKVNVVVDSSQEAFVAGQVQVGSVLSHLIYF